MLVLTTFDDDDALWGALDAGAAGFVLKDASAEDLIAAARAVAGGAAWLDPKVAPRVLRAFRTNVRPAPGRGGAGRRADRARARRAAPHGPRRHQHARSPRRSIVSEATVKTHVGAIFSKLGVRDRAAAIVFAYDHGIVEPRPGAEPT